MVAPGIAAGMVFRSELRSMNLRGLTVAAVMALVSAAAPVSAQGIRLAAPVEVARESDPRRFSEPHLAIHPADPKHLLAGVIVSWVQGTFEEMQSHQHCAAFVSRDGGATWGRHEFALSNCGDPQVAVLPDGQAVFIALADFPGVQPRRGDWLIVFHSSDGGLTWDPEPTIIGRGHDHPAVAVDLTSPERKGWIYVTTHHSWRDGHGQLASGIFITRSRNGGRSFDTPVVVSPNNLHNFGEMPAVLSDGTVIASFVDDTYGAVSLERRRAWIIRSTDGATTFSLPFFVNDICGPPPSFQLSALVADTSGGLFRDRLYFACRRHAGGPVVVTASSDRGATWNASATPAGSTSSDPSARRVMTMEVTNTGVVGVFVAERRPASSEGCLKFGFSASFDGATTFGAPQHVATSACGNSPGDKITEQRFPTYGDYFGLISTPSGNFRLLWAQMEDGHSVLLTASVDVEGRPSGRSAK
jgi:hypothetical protein